MASDEGRITRVPSTGPLFNVTVGHKNPSGSLVRVGTLLVAAAANVQNKSNVCRIVHENPLKHKLPRVSTVCVLNK